MINWLIAILEPVLAWLCNAIPAFGRLLNGIMIDRIVKLTRPRPHPWSTKTPYISWGGLTDRTYSARHLPAIDPGPLPSDAETAGLFSRIAPQQVLCDKSTMLFPSFAQYLTDGFIRTQVSNDDALTDRSKNTSNHEIDLCPLYGRNDRQTHALRLCSETAGTKGRLKSQFFFGDQEYPQHLCGPDGTIKSEFLDLDEPLGLSKLPEDRLCTLFAVGGDRANGTIGVSMINTLLLREHNRIAGLIEADNPAWDDSRVFETTRNVLIVIFIKLVVEEYINHISPSRIRLLADPTVAWTAPWNKPNWITAEFSLLYRWHSLVAETMDWQGVPVSTGNLRFANDLLINAGLASAFSDMSAQCAAHLSIGNTPDYLIPVEEKAINQGRSNHLASYNAYRELVKLPFAAKWEDVSSNPEIVKRLEAAYPLGVESLDFYVGIFAEDRVENSPLPSLILRMVAIDAFSQALTNPLLSKTIWGNPQNRLAAFTQHGLDAIAAASTLKDLLVRNHADPGVRFVGMTRRDWKRSSAIQPVA